MTADENASAVKVNNIFFLFPLIQIRKSTQKIKQKKAKERKKKKKQKKVQL